MFDNVMTMMKKKTYILDLELDQLGDTSRAAVLDAWRKENLMNDMDHQWVKEKVLATNTYLNPEQKELLKEKGNPDEVFWAHRNPSYLLTAFAESSGNRRRQ